jgi:exosortase/archaeosortase family protein
VPAGAAFALRFAAGWLGGALVLAAVPAFERWAVGVTVRQACTALQTGGVAASTEGSLLFAGPVSLQIVPDCTPLMPILGLWAAIVAFPTTLAWKGLGLLAGAVALWLYNLGRVLALVWVLRFWPAAFELVHVYLWQAVTLLLVGTLFWFWLRFAPRPRAAR